MAERRTVGGMMQRRLGEDPPPPEEPGEEPSTEDDPSAAPPETAAPSAARPPLQLDGPSDAGLRKRQDAWLEERARHEAYRRAHRVDASADAGARS